MLQSCEGPPKLRGSIPSQYCFRGYSGFGRDTKRLYAEWCLTFGHRFAHQTIEHAGNRFVRLGR